MFSFWSTNNMGKGIWYTVLTQYMYCTGGCQSRTKVLAKDRWHKCLSQFTWHAGWAAHMWVWDFSLSGVYSIAICIIWFSVFGVNVIYHILQEPKRWQAASNLENMGEHIIYTILESEFFFPVGLVSSQPPASNRSRCLAFQDYIDGFASHTTRVTRSSTNLVEDQQTAKVYISFTLWVFMLC